MIPPCALSGFWWCTRPQWDETSEGHQGSFPYLGVTIFYLSGYDIRNENHSLQLVIMDSVMVKYYVCTKCFDTTHGLQCIAFVEHLLCLWTECPTYKVRILRLEKGWILRTLGNVKKVIIYFPYTYLNNSIKAWLNNFW